MVPLVLRHDSTSHTLKTDLVVLLSIQQILEYFYA